ncbi:MAG TPA: hypothetical protein VNF47_19735 [Streptosporangiaceae bacterium]|nr:hypothetical protein [Streptosporangiaceae bacterium]
MGNAVVHFEVGVVADGPLVAFVMPVTGFGGAVTIAMFNDPNGLLVGDVVSCAEPASPHRVADVTAPTSFRAAVALTGAAPFVMEAGWIRSRTSGRERPTGSLTVRESLPESRALG